MRLVFLFLCTFGVLCGETPASNKKTVVQTPFGPTMRAAQPASTPRRAPDLSLISVEEKGDTITFRRKTPFGQSVWTRQRSELTPFDREILAVRDFREAARDLREKR